MFCTRVSCVSILHISWVFRKKREITFWLKIFHPLYSHNKQAKNRAAYIRTNEQQWVGAGHEQRWVCGQRVWDWAGNSPTAATQPLLQLPTLPTNNRFFFLHDHHHHCCHYKQRFKFMSWDFCILGFLCPWDKKIQGLGFSYPRIFIC